MDVFIKLALFISVLISTAIAEECKLPKPAENFSIEKFMGTWYEIGKIQTAGGAKYQEGCYCTSLSVEQPEEGRPPTDATAVNKCMWESPTGEPRLATGSLYDSGPAGHWRIKYFWFVPSSGFTVLALGDDYAVTYDCMTKWFGWGGIGYCIHILSRTPTQDPEVTERLLQVALDMGLNPEGLNYTATRMEGCQFENNVRNGNSRPEL
ncbi:apolipoprotein D-like [Glandiceps talaboti]